MCRTHTSLKNALGKKDAYSEKTAAEYNGGLPCSWRARTIRRGKATGAIAIWISQAVPILLPMPRIYCSGIKN